VGPDYSKILPLGQYFRLWALFYEKCCGIVFKNIAQNSPKYLDRATFCLKMSKFWPEILLEKSSYLLRIHFGRFFDKTGQFVSQNIGRTDQHNVKIEQLQRWDFYNASLHHFLGCKLAL
jgi:hypothetical protein